MGKKCVVELEYGDEIDEELGAGAFGTVYKMNSPSWFRPHHPIVAVKEIRVSFNQVSLLIHFSFFSHAIRIRQRNRKTKSKY